MPAMGIFARKQAPQAQRQPHPDARTEAQLRAVLALHRAAARSEELAAQYQEEIRVLHGDLRKAAARYQRSPTSARVSYGVVRTVTESRIASLQGEIRQLEKDITAAHDEIAVRTSALSDTDLAYLGRG